MNKTWYASFVSDTIDGFEPIIKNSSNFTYCLGAVLISLEILFLFYAYVNRVNRERDKNTLVFPIIDHFYAMMKVTHVIYYIISFTVFFFYMYKIFGPSVVLGTLFICYYILVGLLMFVLATFTQVFQFFLTVMAIQKFLLYFFPLSQKYIILSTKNMKHFIRYVYFLFMLIEVVGSISFFVYRVIIFKQEEYHSDIVDFFGLVYLALVDMIFFASALLYIPILISVRKHSHLRSFQESKPQIYIFWQTMTAVVAKMISTSVCLYYDSSNNIFLFSVETRFLDIFAVPFIIQISYLTCNRQNIITLFSLFKGRKLVKELIVPEVTTRVSPDPRRHLV